MARMEPEVKAARAVARAVTPLDEPTRALVLERAARDAGAAAAVRFRMALEAILEVEDGFDGSVCMKSIANRALR